MSEVSLKTWVSQGVGHDIPYSGECNSSDEDLVTDLIGDVTSPRSGLLVTNAAFASESSSIVAALSSYAKDRSDYDASYVANKSSTVTINASHLVEGTTQPFVEAINTSFDTIRAATDLLVSCISPRGDDNGNVCPTLNVREQLDSEREQLVSRLVAVGNTLQEYKESLAEYEARAVEVQVTATAFYTDVRKIAQERGVEMAELWTEYSINDFEIPAAHLPEYTFNLTELSEVRTAADIWDNVSSIYVVHLEKMAEEAGGVLLLAESWESVAMQLLGSLEANYSLDDYDPPQFQGASSHEVSIELLELAVSDFDKALDAFVVNVSTLLGDLGPLAANRSFPSAPALPDRNVSVSNSTLEVESSIDYNFAEFASEMLNFGEWTISLNVIGALLIAADYIFRAISTVRLLIQFWGRGGLKIPDADLRVDKHVTGATGFLGNLRAGLFRILLHPSATLLFCSALSVLILFNMAVLYIPFYEDYRAGCVEHTQNGSFFSQNFYSIAFNYAADPGNRDAWSFQART